MKRVLPRYPIFIPSKGRHDVDLTMKFMDADGVPYRLVVEPQDRDDYARKYGAKRVLVLPENDRGLPYSRNWIKALAADEGHFRHWQIDDNISGIWRWWRGHRLYCSAGVALRASEDFTDRYENVALSGLNYVMFAMDATKPFNLNVHVYSCTLVRTDIPNRFRGPNEDVDMCLQVLADGWCTILFNAFLVQKLGTMVVKGGQTDFEYHGDGRLKMARDLQRRWPGVVTTGRRWGRPQHVVSNQWRKFDNKLVPKKGLRVRRGVDEYGMRLVQKKEIKSERIRKLLTDVASPFAGAKPRFPVYVLSRGRVDRCTTAELLIESGVEFTLAVEPQEFERYSERFGERVESIGQNDKGVAFARRWIKRRSIERGEPFHWAIDDNIRWFGRRVDGRNRRAPAAEVLAEAEAEFTRWRNVAIGGLYYTTFAWTAREAVSVNRQPASCVFVRNDVDVTWRDRTNEDTDYAMQCLAAGLCTMVLTRLLIDKPGPTEVPGGCTEYYKSGGREIRSEGLLRAWPNAFRIRRTKSGMTTIAPSRVWSTFKQRPILTDDARRSIKSAETKRPKNRNDESRPSDDRRRSRRRHKSEQAAARSSVLSVGAVDAGRPTRGKTSRVV